ncbi:homoserine O-acetyltransferase MetX [Desulfotalea psychrophila]|uniref:Homoserine O-acetyltransferase n=1 Tax=Desulfotalea psychrophila (strain LSv54 / DSM 12343) TaxID=177439 RepID=METXA_DESPS|nr:homoserine O-acetyltransferase [Desulfotalea psychrophila]Q6ANV2.2 RecName: Full=Homoserine O-acetyltransferase; Short=HAT; AltName: Full=Homoserine transacetylase; Short=HTA [Desulfotalea psychrophila LSv54]
MEKEIKDHKSVGIVEKQFFTCAQVPSPLILENGAKLGPITIAYETYGNLSARKDNAILINHAFSGDSHVAGHYATDGPKEKPGWWDFLVGPGKGIDTDKYFIICSNILGSCNGTTGPASKNSETGEAYALDFPMVTIGDMVATQKLLIDHLGIPKLLAVIGGSVGGMQTLEWAIRYPEMMHSVIPIATTMRHSALAIAFNEIARQAIMTDPHWNRGKYYGQAHPDTGLAVARMVGHVTYLSDEAMRRKFGRNLQEKENLSYGFDADFQVESYLRYQGNKFVHRFDANSLLYITKASDYFDIVERISTSGPETELTAPQQKYLVISYSSDWLYPTYQARDLVKALKRSGRNVSFSEIESDCGHDAFLIPDDRLEQLMRGFLAGIYTGIAEI